MQDRRPLARWWVPLVVVGVVGAALAWLNQAPPWGWVVVAAAVAVSGVLAWPWQRSRWFVQTTAWVLGAALVAGVALTAGPVPSTRTIDGAHTTPVPTAQGPVVGVRDADAHVDTFAGVPYAAPPVGRLRWAAPEPAPRRTGTLVADDFGPSAVQSEPSFATRALTRVLDLPLEQTLLGGYRTDEDSLRLNVWRPSGTTGARLPVLVYVHGGSFVAGSGAFPAYDGTALASSGKAVVVTMNYRLGVFGFLAADALGGDTPGNQGLLDQLAALRWVHANIDAFGGDPERVTLAGESAGSGSACILGASPMAAGFVHGIIGESGGCLGTAGDRADGDLYDDRTTAAAAARTLRKALGGASLAEMQRMPSARIQAAATSLTQHWWPTIDDAVMPRTPAETYAAGEHNDVPLLLGSNADETSLELVTGVDDDPGAYEQEAREQFGADADTYLRHYPGSTSAQVVAARIRSTTDQTMTAPMRRWALTAAGTGRAPVFTYRFDRTQPDPGLREYGAYHGAEVMYAYGNLGADGDVAHTATDRRLESEMSGAWLAFVERGSPVSPGVPRWPTVQDAPGELLEFGDDTGVVDRPTPAAVDFWLDRDGTGIDDGRP